MKRSAKFKLGAIVLTAAVLTAGAAIFCSCQPPHPETVSVTFRAVNEEDIVINVKYGSSVEAPAVPEKAGNEGHWEETDLSSVTEDLTVNAVYETKGLTFKFIGGENVYEVGRSTTALDGVKELFVPKTHLGIPVARIAASAFSWADDAVAAYLPDGLTTIGSNAFFSCPLLGSITIPDTVTTIGDAAFYGCDSLGSITIPDAVTTMGESLFGHCVSLKTVKLSKNIKTIPPGFFENCVALEEYSIPETVTLIGEKAFDGCTALASVVFPEGLQSIGLSAFYGCTALVSVKLPKSLKSIDYAAFYGCTALQTIDLGGVEQLGNFMFDSSGLTEIVIPDGVTSIPDGCFKECRQLKSVRIPETVTKIGNQAFSRCSALREIVIPSSVVRMWSLTFQDWTSEQTIYVEGYAEKPASWEKGWCGGATVVWRG